MPRCNITLRCDRTDLICRTSSRAVVRPAAGDLPIAIESPDGLPVPIRYWAILTVAIGVMMAVLDGAIANVALPSIARDVHADPASSIWVINAYQLAITVSLLPLASLGDILGYRRVYQVGLLMFTLASLACSLSTGLTGLTLARVAQGFGAAGIMSVNGALVRFIYPRSMLGRGVAINAMVVAIASALGPTIASGILSVASWPWLFAVNVPLGVIAQIVAAPSLPRTRRSPHKFDVFSALLNALTFGLVITGIDGFGHGESALLAVLELLAGLGAGTVLVFRQLSLPMPLLPVDLLRIPIFGLSVATSIVSFGAQSLAYVALPFYLQDALGRGQVETGLLMTPWPLAVVVIAPISGRLADRYPAGALGGIGMALMACGMAALALLPPHPGNVDIAWRVALTGLGFGLFQTPNNRAMLSAAPRERSGGASGMLSTARLTGQTTGAALVALVFGLAPANGTSLAIAIGAGFALAAAGVSCLRLAQPARAAAGE
jgi:DHA2 family multidrug resistance protein-like MFS transporter